MGLLLTLEKNQNHLNTTFINAYWSIDDISYTTEDCFFRLNAYPSREAKLVYKNVIHTNDFPIGNTVYPTYEPIIYIWSTNTLLTNIFKDGIPLSVDNQKTLIYQYVKSYTGLPFQDVFEENQDENQ